MRTVTYVTATLYINYKATVILERGYSTRFLTLTSHSNISPMVTVFCCPDTTHNALSNVRLSASASDEAKNWTTAFSKVSWSQ